MDRLRRGWRAAAPYAVPALAFLAIILAIYWRAWTPLEGERRGFAYDAQWEYWGDLQYQVDAVRDGELPLWNPHDRLGYPFHSDPQVGNLYPVRWPFIAAGAIGGSVPWWSISVMVLLHFWIAALGTFAVLRRRGMPRYACYLGGVLAITSYAMLHNTFSTLNWSFAWVPWWLYAADAWIEKPGWPRAALVAATASLCALAGGWASFWYGCLVVVPIAVVGLVEQIRARTGDERRAYVRMILVTGAAAIGGFVVLAGAQIAATAQILGETVRDDRGVRFFGTTVFGAHDIVGFFIPRAQGENTYLGWGPILWTAAVVALRPTGRNLTLAALVGVAVLCAMGTEGPALSTAASVAPPFEFFRRAHRYLFVMVIPIALLASEGLVLFASLDADARARCRRVVIVASALLVTVCGIGYAFKVQHPWKPDPVRDAFGWGLGAALVGGFATWLVLSQPARRAVIILAVVIAGVDLWVARSGKVESVFHPIPRTPHDGAAIAAAGGPPPRRIYDFKRVSFRPGIRLGIRDLGGYEGDPLALKRFARVLGSVGKFTHHAAHAAIVAVFEVPGRGAQRLPGDDQVTRQVAAGQTAILDAVGDVVWYDAAELVADGGAAWDRVIAAAPGTIAVADRVPAGLRDRVARVDAPGTPPVPGRLVALGRNTLRAEIDAPADGVVAIAEMYYQPGWTATVDGADAAIIAVNGFMRGVVVGPGHHVIEMEFSATWYVAWGGLAILGWFGCVGYAIVLWRRRRRGDAT